MRKTALFLSHLLNPSMLALLVFGALGWQEEWFIGVVGAGVYAVLPGLSLLLLVRLRRLDQIYPDDRGVRGVLLLQGALCYALGWGVLYGLGASLLVLVTAATYVVNTLSIWVINRHWKISIHAAGVGGTSCILLVSVGELAWPFVLSLPAITWARLYLRAHTPVQIGAGAALGAGSSAVLYAVFDLL